MIKLDKDTLFESLKQNDLFSTIKKITTSDDTVTVLVHHVRSLSRHVDHTVSDNRIINNDIIVFTETQSNPSDSTCKIIKTLILLNINFNKSENKFSCLAYRRRNDVAVLSKFDANELSGLRLKKLLPREYSIQY